MRLPLALAAILTAAACGVQSAADNATTPMTYAPSSITAAAAGAAPAMRWGSRKGGDAWTQDLLATLSAEGVQLTSSVPRDINAFCPGYAAQSADGRRAFWAGLLSALARHESGHNPAARGGGGRYLGLMQISPATWRQYGCSGKMLDGGDNLSCAARIVARNVVRDGAIAGGKGGWRGVARDWGPMRVASKRGEIAAWTSRQPYCSGGGGA